MMGKISLTSYLTTLTTVDCICMDTHSAYFCLIRKTPVEICSYHYCLSPLNIDTINQYQHRHLHRQQHQTKNQFHCCPHHQRSDDDDDGDDDDDDGGGGGGDDDDDDDDGGGGGGGGSVITTRSRRSKYKFACS